MPNGDRGITVPAGRSGAETMMSGEPGWAEIEAEWRARFGGPPPVRGETRLLRELLDVCEVWDDVGEADEPLAH